MKNIIKRIFLERIDLDILVYYKKVIENINTYTIIWEDVESVHRWSRGKAWLSLKHSLQPNSRQNDHILQQTFSHIRWGSPRSLNVSYTLSAEPPPRNENPMDSNLGNALARWLVFPDWWLSRETSRLGTLLPKLCSVEEPHPASTRTFFS